MKKIVILLIMATLLSMFGSIGVSATEQREDGLKFTRDGLYTHAQELFLEITALYIRI